MKTPLEWTRELWTSLHLVPDEEKTSVVRSVIAAAIAEARADEREACARVAVNHARLFDGAERTDAVNACVRSAEDIADAIRARGAK